MCIYYKYRSGLSYTSGEHIFPAAIGGIQKLPDDYVSTEFNNAISGLELDFIRNSFIAVAREAEGPGKRGKLAERHATKSPVQVIQGAEDSEILSLGCIKKGKIYEIPHLSLNTDTRQYQMSFDKSVVNDINEAIEEFKRMSKQVEESKIKVIESDLLPLNPILFGIDKTVDTKFSYFFAKHPEAKLTIDSQKILAFGESLKYSGEELRDKKYLPSAKRQVKFSIDFFRIYGKIAFNLLAFLKGKEFVLADSFDELRNWIAEGGENKYATLNNGNFSALKQMNLELPASCHHILIYKVDQRLMATVYFYEALSVDIELLSNYSEKFSTDGFICDWKNRKEYRLFKYLQEKYLIPAIEPE